MTLKIRSHSLFSCKIFFFVCYLFSSFSSYLYALLAFERWHAIAEPIKYKNKSKKNFKRSAILFLFCTSLKTLSLNHLVISSSILSQALSDKYFGLLLFFESDQLTSNQLSWFSNVEQIYPMAQWSRRHWTKIDMVSWGLSYIRLSRAS